ncbi:hypothetical protein NPIL_85061, partial [Nephila pilipes]
QDHLRRIGKLYRKEIRAPRELMDMALDPRRTICPSLLSWYEEGQKRRLFFAMNCNWR